MKDLTPKEVSELIKQCAESPLLLDVREPQEYQFVHIANSLHIPMNQIPARIGELDPEQEMIIICHHGMRSMQVAMFLKQKGFSRVINLKGGIDAWAQTVDPSLKRY